MHGYVCVHLQYVCMHACMRVCVPEAGSDGGHVAVQAALVPAHVERQRALEETAEDLHLIRTRVLCYFKPLH